MAEGTPVRSADGDIAAIGTTTDLDTSLTVIGRLKQLVTRVTALEGLVDGIEGFTDGVEALITTISGNIVDIETLLTTISGNVDGLEGFTDGIEALLTTVSGNVVDIETLLTTISGNVDSLEGFTDGIEALLTTISGNVDGIETSLTTIIGHVDGIEGFIDGIETLLTALSGVAHDAVDSGNPFKIGYKAIAHGTNPTAVAANDRTDAYANRHGVPFVIGGHPNIQSLEFEFTAAMTNAALITVSAGTKIVVTGVMVFVSKATTVNVGVRIGFAAATLPAVSTSGTAGIILSADGIGPGGGANRGGVGGMLGVGADGEDLRVTSSVPTTGNLRVTVTYYTIES